MTPPLQDIRFHRFVPSQPPTPLGEPTYVEWHGRCPACRLRLVRYSSRGLLLVGGFRQAADNGVWERRSHPLRLSAARRAAGIARGQALGTVQRDAVLMPLPDGQKVRYQRLDTRRVHIIRCPNRHAIGDVYVIIRPDRLPPLDASGSV